MLQTRQKKEQRGVQSLSLLVAPKKIDPLLLVYDDVFIAFFLTDFEFLFSLKGLTPPLEGASDEETLQHAEKFMNKSRSLAVDGYIVYDIQDEEGRTEMARPFPFRKLGDPAAFATVLERVSGGRVVGGV